MSRMTALLVVGTLFAAPLSGVQATDAPGAAAGSTAKFDVDAWVAGAAGDERSPSRDPFRVLVPEPKEEVTRVTPRVDPLPPPAPAPAPLEAAIVGFASEGGHCTAVLEYGGTVQLVEPGWSSEDGRVTVGAIRMPSGESVEVELQDSLTGQRSVRTFGKPRASGEPDRVSCLAPPFSCGGVR
ncbi:MAG: hypothetical protein HY303_18720 [Candidatus Wallbacteria bacterium]|nr:hypothetical protein [Candidatus Wallbacteria bacterium]